MNDDKKRNKYFTEKGLYIVLFVCVAIVGIASWALLFHGLGNDETAVPVSGTVDEVLDEENDSETAEPETEAPEAEETKSAEPADEAVSVWKEVEPTTEEPVEEPKEDSTEKTADYIWPLAGAVQVSYSMDELVYDKTMADWRTHDGIDIEAQVGTRVMAVTDGTVTEVNTDDMYGTTVVISHSDGTESIYSNLASVPTVEVGDTVSCGDIIGSVGDTAEAETSEVSHLHFAMKKDGKSVDPNEFLPNR
ncbi:MAG: M23 family metallopeptidase [Ruminococcaceae bacterium]|nr:M23 family metallopeptidase [Oscillospiraceae bacterium]